MGSTGHWPLAFLKKLQCLSHIEKRSSGHVKSAWMYLHVSEPEVLAPPGRRLHDVLRAKDGTSRLKGEKGPNWIKLDEVGSNQ